MKKVEAIAEPNLPWHCLFRTGLDARRYLLSNGSSFGEGLRGPKGFEGEVGLDPLCCGQIITFHKSSVYETGTFIVNLACEQPHVWVAHFLGASVHDSFPPDRFAR